MYDIQIKIAMSVDKLRILIKILAESHMAFDLGDNIDIQLHTYRQALFPTHAHKEVGNRAGMSVCVQSNADVIELFEGQYDFQTKPMCISEGELKMSHERKLRTPLTCKKHTVIGVTQWKAKNVDSFGMVILGSLFEKCSRECKYNG